MLKNRVDFLVESSKGKTLHIGCGHSALHLILLDKMKEKLYGLDAYDYSKVYPRFTQAYAENMPIADETFDTVILGDIWMHVDNIDDVLHECHRILKRGGILLITAPNFNSLWNRVTHTYAGNFKKSLRKILGVRSSQEFNREYVYKRRTTLKSIASKLYNINLFYVEKYEILPITIDVGCIFGRGNLQHGAIMDFRYLLCQILPESLREQIVIKAVK